MYVCMQYGISKYSVSCQKAGEFPFLFIIYPQDVGMTHNPSCNLIMRVGITYVRRVEYCAAIQWFKLKASNLENALFVFLFHISLVRRKF